MPMLKIRSVSIVLLAAILLLLVPLGLSIAEKFDLLAFLDALNGDTLVMDPPREFPPGDAVAGGGPRGAPGSAATESDAERRRSLATLDALAKALNVPISRLFAETDERRDCSFVKAGHGVRIERRGTKAGHLYDLLGHSLRGEIAVEPYLITLRKNAVPYTNFRHGGVEFIYMLSGKVRYLHSDRSYLMEPGDALFFDAAARHGPEELIETPMQYLSIIIYPRRE